MAEGEENTEPTFIGFDFSTQQVSQFTQQVSQSKVS